MNNPTKAYELYKTDHEFYIRTTIKEFQIFQAIKINRLTSKISLIKSQQKFIQQIKASNCKKSQAIDLIMGTIIVNQQPYLLVVTQIQSAGILKKQKIYQIKKTGYIPFKHKFLYNSIDQSENQKILLYLKQQLLKDNFYFCYHQDLTLTRIKAMDKQKTLNKFFWNQQIMHHFLQAKINRTWIVPVVQGHVRELYCQNQNFTFYFLMISRRSKGMAGTRFNHRGLNQKFQTSNFVQTEEIFICHNFLFSHVSLRGSVPLFWKQQSVKADILFQDRLQQQHQQSITNHYRLLQQQYKGKICTINLLSKSKSPQKQLKSRFQYYHKKFIDPQLYLYFDLNQQMKQQSGQKSINNFLQSFSNFTCPQNFFVMDRFTNKVYCVQQIYPRVNCLDCIDRTNVIMQRICQHFCGQVQKFINDKVGQEQKKLLLGDVFWKSIIDIWVQLGNRISMIYCGTESVANHMTKKQNNSFLSFLSGGIKSINRYYNANVGDNFKHQCIEHLLGKRGVNSKTQYFEDNISRKVLNKLNYCTYSQMKIYIVTWNCSMVDPCKLSLNQKQKLFNFISQDICLVIFNLQQLVQLSSYNVLLGNNTSILQDWSKTILQCLNTPQYNKNLELNKTFKLVTNHDLVGIATFVFAVEQICQRVERFQWLNIKTGFKGNSGHKGGIVLFMQIDHTWITFINCHLASGEGKRTERFQDIQFIHNQAIRDRRKRRLLDISQFKFLVGDMNFGIDLKNQLIRQALTTIEKRQSENNLTLTQLKQLLKPLLQKDQKCQYKVGHLNSYNQAQIHFLPTYKYSVATKSYDIKKTPCWYDRIMYQSIQNNRISTIRYNDIDVYLSDHKPVYAIFNVLIRKENKERKEKYIRSYLEQ